MKTLSIKNPWAFLICSGIKDVENRTWPTNFRGRVLIHASGKDTTPISDSNILHPQLIAIALQKLSDDDFNSELKTGAIIGNVEIVDCVQGHPSIWAEHGMVTFLDKYRNVKIKPIYNWVLANPILFPTSIPNIKGHLSFWNYDGQIPEL